MDAIKEAIHKRPILVLAVTHSVTSFAYLWWASEGRPFSALKKMLFRAALSAVPASVVAAELDKTRQSIKEDVVGHAMDSEAPVVIMPSKGTSAPHWLPLFGRPPLSQPPARFCEQAGQRRQSPRRSTRMPPSTRKNGSRAR